MDETTMRGYEARLRAELVSLSEESMLGADDRAPVALDQQAVGRLSRMDAMQRQAMAVARARRLAARRIRIEAALSRIREGEFGWCLRCGEEIPPARLDLDPALLDCIGCAKG